MAAPASPESYKEVILFLATAGVVVPLFLRLKISPVLGFLGAGVLLGPLGLGRFVGEAPWLSWITIGNRQEIAHLAEFGVVFLLFMIGIELSWERLWTLRRLVFGLGSLQVVACAAVLGAIAFALGAEPAPAAFVGVALALSSTAIVVPVLAAQKRLASPTGRATFSVLLFQDLAVAPVLFTIGVLGTRQSGGLGMAFILALAQAAAAIVVIVTVGRLVLRPLFGLVAATKSTELFMALSLLVVLATGLVAAASGLSMALGAFIAGLLLAETEYRRAIEAMIDPFKGLLLGVFFVSVGMALDVTQLARNPGTILLGVVGLIAVKTVVIAALGAAFRLARPVAFESALLLGPGGEFAFVILAGAVVAGLVPEPIGQFGLVVATVSMIAIPGLARIGRSLRRRLESRRDEARAEPLPAPEKGRVILAGFGRVGQMVGEMLARHNVSYLAIDQNPVLVRGERRAGKPVYFGDSANPEVPAPLRHRERARPRRHARQPGRHRGGGRGRARRAPRPHDRGAGARCPPCDRALRARRRRRGAGELRGQPSALRGRARRYRRADGPRHRLGARAPRRVPQDAGPTRTASGEESAPQFRGRRKRR